MGVVAERFERDRDGTEGRMVKRHTQLPHTSRNWTESDFRFTERNVPERAMPAIATPKTRKASFTIRNPERTI